MKKPRKHYTAEEKVAILRRHLVEQEPVSKLCDELGLQPTVLYRWQKEFFENGPAAFQPKSRSRITPANLNVLYELGYAHALKTPTILLAQRGGTLPFDISSFRVVFYDDTIAGKARIEQDLAKHLDAINESVG